MKKLYYTFYIFLFTLLFGTSCGEDRDLMISSGKGQTQISEILISTDYLIYGQESILSFDLDDPDNISHVTVKILIDNANVQEEVIPINANHAKIDYKLLIPFKMYSLEKDVTIDIEVFNKQLVTTRKSVDAHIKRPVFDKLYFETENGESLELTQSSEAYVYAIEGTFDQYTTGFVYSEPGKQGYKWGMNLSTNKGELNSDIAFELEDSNSSTIGRIAFDAVSFAISPLREVMSVNEVEFVRDPDNQDLRTVSLNLTENGVLNFQLIDVQAVSFDPIYFSVDNDRVVYIGNTGNCKLIYNEAYQVMFIENSTNRLGGEGDLYINGWGIGWPDLWSNNPDWNFDNAIVLTKHADNKYHFTSAVSKWGTFKFYTDKDWGDEIDLQQMTVTTPILAVEEEDGKPGNYNIYYKPQSDTETIIVRFTYDFDTNTLDASIIKEIN